MGSVIQGRKAVLGFYLGGILCSSKGGDNFTQAQIYPGLPLAVFWSAPRNGDDLMPPKASSGSWVMTTLVTFLHSEICEQGLSAELKILGSGSSLESTGRNQAENLHKIFGATEGEHFMLEDPGQ
ncbi:hypothetical protein WISP_23626 [Willisornis vidua]|uniref:Uncharacterized protein n=1 Tax=Willisornis vidua TaxID=1566151 RepID=A0ABQ9DME3_9PASS|nr:hypothetical protein WISP_23626 [Willisornis vidua]